MIHKKQHQIELIDTCWGFVAWNYIFWDQKCWLRHSAIKLSDGKCKLSTENFETNPEFTKHRKKYQSVVPMCKRSLSRKCEFWWFIHNMETDKYDIPNEVEHMENNVVIERSFDLVANISETKMNKNNEQVRTQK